MGTAEQEEFFEDLPTSEYRLDASGRWIDRLAPIRGERSGVRRAQGSAQRKQPAIALGIMSVAVALGLIVVAGISLAFVPKHLLRLEQPNVTESLAAGWSPTLFANETADGAAGRPEEAPQPMLVRRVVLRPIVIRAAFERIFPAKKTSTPPSMEATEGSADDSNNSLERGQAQQH